MWVLGRLTDETIFVVDVVSTNVLATKDSAHALIEDVNYGDGPR
eukprot:gene30363-56694_t